MPITREIGFGTVARTGRQELRDYGIVRVSDRLRWALLDDSPLIKHRDSSGNQKGSFWDRILGTCGGLAAATGKLVAELRITFFGRYRCHQRRVSRI